MSLPSCQVHTFRLGHSLRMLPVLSQCAMFLLLNSNVIVSADDSLPYSKRNCISIILQQLELASECNVTFQIL